MSRNRTDLVRRYAAAGRMKARLSWLDLQSRIGRTRVIASGGPVVCLTTHGQRFETVHLVIQSIASGKVLPSRLILWLDEPSPLPSPLLRLQRRGLEVKIIGHKYGPHSKYYPYVESEPAFAQPLVTADDDIIYPREWLSKLNDAYRQRPDAINCYRARVIQTRGGCLCPYSEWALCQSVEPSFTHFATGVSGVIYPPAFLASLKLAGAKFRPCCPRADDIWLHVHAVRSGHRVCQIQPGALHFPEIPGTEAFALFHSNMLASEPENDIQARLTYTESDIRAIESEARRHADRLAEAHKRTRVSTAIGARAA